jgi:hypothetical protein
MLAAFDGDQNRFDDFNHKIYNDQRTRQEGNSETTEDQTHAYAVVLKRGQEEESVNLTAYQSSVQ